MKKAVLLLGMVTLIAGCICLKNADMNTVLYHQRIQQGAQYADSYPAEYTEEISSVEEMEETNEEAQTVSQDLSQIEEENPVQQVVYDDITGVIYEKLTQNEQKIYAEILDSLLSYEEETPLSTTDSKLIDKAFTCVMLDHPEIFYVDGYKYTEYMSGDIVEEIVFAGNYMYDREEIKRRQNVIDKKVANILDNTPDTEDEYLKVKFVYDTLVQQTEYDTGSADNQNICSVFLNGKSVCQGYAKALQYLLNELGIKCSLVLGTVTNGEGHAWNLVSVNGAWYYLDATWGDAFYLFGEQEQAAVADTNLINYDYFCATTRQMMMTHTPDMPVEMPDCTAVVDNYYVREGLYFTGFDEEKLASVFGNAATNGQETVTIKCSDGTVYDEMCRILLDEQKIFDFVATEGTVAYTDNEEQGSLTFWLFEGRY